MMIIINIYIFQNMYWNVKEIDSIAYGTDTINAITVLPRSLNFYITSTCLSNSTISSTTKSTMDLHWMAKDSSSMEEVIVFHSFIVYTVKIIGLKKRLFF